MLYARTSLGGMDLTAPLTSRQEMHAAKVDGYTCRQSFTLADAISGCLA